MSSIALNTLPNQLDGLAARTQLLENLLDSCCSAFAVCDAEGEIQYCNRAAKRLLKSLSPQAALALQRGRNRQAFQHAVQELSQSPTRRPVVTLRLDQKRVLATLSSLALPGEDWVRMVFHHPRTVEARDLQGFACHYALTPKETRVAEQLACGRSVAEIAEQQGR
ncbi:PAS domain-containing protein, partial [Alcanivorax sp.]